jgi:hypothetical protein
MWNHIFPSRKRIKTHRKCHRNHVEIPKPKVTYHLELCLRHPRPWWALACHLRGQPSDASEQAHQL